jgi:glycosyltransferase involved in cell wall biosynthesis
MRIGIDARPIQGRFTGDCTYWRGLIGGLSSIDSDDEYLIYMDPHLAVPEIPVPAGFQIRQLKSVSWRIWSAWNFPIALRSDGVKVAHVQYTIPPWAPCPVVTSIHDVSFKKHPEFFSVRDRLILDAGVKYAAKHAAVILAISESTKSEICELYGIPPQRIIVVYPGIDDQCPHQIRYRRSIHLDGGCNTTSQEFTETTGWIRTLPTRDENRI